MSVRWSTIPRRANACSGLMYRSVPSRSPRGGQARITLEPCQPEVGDPELSIVVDQKIGGLDIAVNHSQAVRMLQRLGGLDPQPRDQPEK